MSAWLCSDKHIFELAQYFVDKCQTYSSSKLTFEQAAEELYKENVRSLNYRYDDDDFADLNPPHAYMRTVFDPAVLAKQVNCYEYQACEHPAWEESKAHEMCQDIKEHLLRNLPGYEDAPWGID